MFPAVCKVPAQCRARDPLPVYLHLCPPSTVLEACTGGELRIPFTCTSDTRCVGCVFPHTNNYFSCSLDTNWLSYNSILIDQPMIVQNVYFKFFDSLRLLHSAGRFLWGLVGIFSFAAVFKSALPFTFLTASWVSPVFVYSLPVSQFCVKNFSYIEFALHVHIAS